MKAHEEVWINDDESAGWGSISVKNNDADPEFGDLDWNVIGEFDTPERRRLAAQAPAMARLLADLLHEYQHGYQSGNPYNDVERVLRAAGVIP